jgi:hypothetical protein
MDGNELVEKMVDAFDEHHGEDRNDMRRRMAAAAKVCIDEALGEPDEDEFAKAQHIDGWNVPCIYLSGYSRLLTARKARLAPKIAESRVTIEPCPRDSWKVLLDGKWQESFSDQRNAETYRRGLIAELKEQHS